MFLVIFILKRSMVYGISTSHLVGYDLLSDKRILPKQRILHFIPLAFIIDCGMGITL